TGTAQGAASKPWYDSSVFAAFSQQPQQPYTVVSYLEKAGYGAKASAPLVKCMMEALGNVGPVMTEPVVSDPLDESSILPAQPNEAEAMTCAVNQYDGQPGARD